MVMLLVYFYIGASGSSNAAGESKIRCLEVERQALLNIKEALHEIQEGFLSTWGNEEEKRDCCEWYGVQCANNSDHVTVLDLAPWTSPIYDENYKFRRYLQGNISHSLCELKHLTYLDLSLINFNGHGIPSFIGTLTKLRYLNLSFTEMSGEIPPQLGNLSSLEVLIFRHNNDLRMKSMGWVSHLSSLRLLDLSSTNMSQVTDWTQVVTKLPHLTNLQLIACNLPNVTSSSLSLVNSSTSLAILNLKVNHLSVSIYQWVFSFSRSLVHLDLSGNALEGSIPEALGNMTSLTYLGLGYNNDLRMKSMGWVSHLSSLRLLDLSSTNMSQATDWLQVVNKLPHLMNLQLRQCNLPNVISSSLSLVYSSTSLAILDLSGNRLSVSVFQWVFSLSRSLVHLDLSSNALEGSFPKAFGNMTSLTYIGLGYNNDLRMKSMGWVSHLSSLRLLDLSRTNMSHATDWMQVINKLPHLTNLQLGWCNLPNVTSSSLSLVNSSTSLAILDLSGNRLSVSIYQWVFSFSRSLVHLDLSSNALEGSIPEALGNLTKLTYLDLGYNNLEGELPNSLGNLCMLRELIVEFNKLSGLLPFELTQSFPRCTYYSLEYLDLSYNRFRGSLPNLTIFPSLKEVFLSGNQYNGTVPETIGQLAQLESLILDGNSLEGVITEAHFSKLTKLSSLDLSDNSLTLKFNDHWVPPFQLDSIRLRSCKLGPQFPRWLQTQSKFNELYISNSGISDSIPDWLWDISPKCWRMDLSNNQINGKIKNSSMEFQSLLEIDLNSNKLEGSIPPFLFNVGALNLSTNRFSRLSSICNVINGSPLSFLDISLNQLSGEIPDCWSPFKRLKILILENNKFSGEIPTSIGSLTEITALHLGKNSLTKELPSSLKNCTNLMALACDPITSLEAFPHSYVICQIFSCWTYP
ncbi:hypothetical protein TIFTF001_034440 [Ficus carica]|uniref:Uncharacterized protein n=1 Tax=Ficus carica TaxID=3494 RepID=A0AA88J8K4_FICCA|nr:hypothetical protein TIFTF001_034440 [Ficus carica]